MASLSYLLYSLALALAMLLSLPYWLYQILRHGKYRTGLVERMGGVPARRARRRSRSPSSGCTPFPSAKSSPWADSSSTCVAAFPSIACCCRPLPTLDRLSRASALAKKTSSIFRWTFAFAIRPYLRALRPELVVLAETEFWPNFLRLAHASWRPHCGGQRPHLRSFVATLSPLSLGFAPDARTCRSFLAQTADDSARLHSIGADAARVQVTGNLKFDVNLPPPPPLVNSLRRSLAAESAGPVLVCGSTVDDEEPPLLKAFENSRVAHPRAVMILAPRHPERFDEVAILIQQLGIPFVRRSQWQDESLAGGVLLVDTIGELAALYALADVAFVGGSLVPRGGHNIIEPAQHGVAIVTGNHTENFRDIVALFQSRDAVRIVGLAELPLTLMQLAGQRCGTPRTWPPRRRHDPLADGRDRANSASAANSDGGRPRSAARRNASRPHRLNPLSLIYGGVVGARNALYDGRILLRIVCKARSSASAIFPPGARGRLRS